MSEKRKRILTLLLGCLAIIFHLQGCATPSEIKKTSQAQLDLIESADGAVAALQAGLDQFHRDKEEQIIDEGRMLIARQAIDVAVGKKDKETINADDLYGKYKSEIQLWVDNAFGAENISYRINDLEKKIKNLDEQINKEQSEPIKNTLRVMKASLKQDQDDLKLEGQKLSSKPVEIKKLEDAIQEDLKNEKETAKQSNQMLEILRAQMALMKAMQSKVDAWLAIDVTVSQEQVDSLEKSFLKAHEALKGGEK